MGDGTPNEMTGSLTAEAFTYLCCPVLLGGMGSVRGGEAGKF